jgi:hypothetical protein
MAKLEYLTNPPASRATKTDINKKKLLEPFTILDKRGTRWHVPSGTVSDGKSVPESLQWAIGDPFEGVTEPAAWVHDLYCVTKIRSQKDTHRIFRELLYHEMKKNNKYGWIRYPWNLQNSKVWQYQRVKMMWLAVRLYNRLKHPNWK